MRNIIITLFIISFFTISGFSQFRFDVFGGYSPASNPVSAGLFVNRHLPHEEFIFNMKRVEPQYFIGAKGQLELSAPFFVEAGLAYTMRKSTYHVEYTMIDLEHPVSDHFLNESQHIIQMPVNLGVNLGSFDITSGLRLIGSISNSTELNQLTGFAAVNQPVRIGWQGGAGFYIMKSRIGIEFQSSFSRVGSGMSVNGQSLELMNVPGQVVFTLQQSF